MCGIEIGKYVLIGAGSVVTKNVLPHSLIYGNPASLKGYVGVKGHKLDKNYYCKIEKKDYSFLRN